MNANELDPDQASQLGGLSDASTEDVDAVATIVVEVRDTAGAASASEIETMLRQRFEQSSVHLDEAEITKLATQIREGD